MTTFIVPTEVPTVHGPPQEHRTYADWENLPEYTIIDPRAGSTCTGSSRAASMARRTFLASATKRCSSAYRRFQCR
jgi:hypothetical protein